MTKQLPKVECQEDLNRIKRTIEDTKRHYRNVYRFLNANQISFLLGNIGKMQQMYREMQEGRVHCPHYYVGDTCCYCQKKGEVSLSEIVQRNRGET